MMDNEIWVPRPKEGQVSLLMERTTAHFILGFITGTHISESPEIQKITSAIKQALEDGFGGPV